MKKKVVLFVVSALIFILAAGCSTEHKSPAAVSEIPNFWMNEVINELEYIELVDVPEGNFIQEAISDVDETASFEHTISGFRIGKYEVTYELWKTVYDWAVDNGYDFANTGSQGNPNFGTTEAYEPVNMINWRDMIVWCNAYSEIMGLKPVYYPDVSFNIPLKSSVDGAYDASINTSPGSFDNPYVDTEADGYRLPTEGEWHYAAVYINGTDWTPYNYASGAIDESVSEIDAVAWYAFNSLGDFQPVGKKRANPLGIYDMSGNICEVCYDWRADYPLGAEENYKGPAAGSYRVVRGSCVGGDWYDLQVGFRGFAGGMSPYSENLIFGFRIAQNK